jgi:hypothetical protein
MIEDMSNRYLLMVLLYAVALAVVMHFFHEQHSVSLTEDVNRAEVMSRHTGTMDFTYWQAKQEWLQREQR